MKKLLEKTEMVEETALGRYFPPFAQIFIFIIVFLAGGVIESVITTVPTVIAVMKSEAVNSALSSNEPLSAEAMVGIINDFMKNLPEWYIVVSLFATAGLIFSAVIFCTKFEKRTLRSMGFRRRHAATEYLSGLLIGGIMFSLAVALAVAAGGLKFDSGVKSGSVAMIILFFLAYVVQGAAEETICRGYLMLSLTRSGSLPVAVAISSVAFSLLHYANSGVSVLAFVNIALFGIFEGVYMLRRGNIWGACAIHTMWNFAQGNVFGLSVSGNPRVSSIFTFQSTENMSRVNGGAFGLEGGLAVTIVLLVATALMLATKTNESEMSALALEERVKWQNSDKTE